MSTPIDTLRQVAERFPTQSQKLDDWQRQFCQDQIARLEKWQDDIRLSEKQGLALAKALATMKKSGGDEQ